MFANFLVILKRSIFVKTAVDIIRQLLDTFGQLFYSNIWSHWEASSFNNEAFFRQKNVTTSVTRFGDLLDFGQLFKAFDNNRFAQISHILRQFFKNVKNLLWF